MVKQRRRVDLNRARFRMPVYRSRDDSGPQPDLPSSQRRRGLVLVAGSRPSTCGLSDSSSSIPPAPITRTPSPFVIEPNASESDSTSGEPLGRRSSGPLARSTSRGARRTASRGVAEAPPWFFEVCAAFRTCAKAPRPFASSSFQGGRYEDGNCQSRLAPNLDVDRSRGSLRPSVSGPKSTPATRCECPHDTPTGRT